MRCTGFTLLQPEAVVLAAHRRAVARKAQHVILGVGQARQPTVCRERYQIALAYTAEHTPLTTQVSSVE